MPTAPAGLECRSLGPIPSVRAGDDLTHFISNAIETSRESLVDQDIIVVAQKICSKAEGRCVDLAFVTPSVQALHMAEETGKDPRLVELILSESRSVLRATRGLIIVEHRLGMVMANAGVDLSNAGGPDGREIAVLLPENPDESCRKLRRGLQVRFGVRVGVIMNDSVGRAWRRGTIGTAIGIAGTPAVADRCGDLDLDGRELRATEVGLADEAAAAASIVMGQGDEGRPAVILRGVTWEPASDSADLLLRPVSQDLFR